MTNANDDRAREENLTPNIKSGDELARLNTKGVDDHVRADALACENQKRLDSLDKNGNFTNNTSTTSNTRGNDHTNRSGMISNKRVATEFEKDSELIKTFERNSSAKVETDARKSSDNPGSAVNDVSKPPVVSSTPTTETPSQSPVESVEASGANSPTGNQGNISHRNPNPASPKHTDDHRGNNGNASMHSSPAEKLTASTEPARNTDPSSNNQSNTNPGTDSDSNCAKPQTIKDEKVADAAAVSKGTTPPISPGSATDNVDLGSSKTTIPANTIANTIGKDSAGTARV